LVFGFLVVLALMLFSDLKKVSEEITTFRWQLYPAVLGLTALNYVLRGLKFHYYVLLVSDQKVPLAGTFRLFLAGFPLAVTPGKVGEALKGVWINHVTGTPIPMGISVVAAERISDGLAVLLLSTVGVIAIPRYWPAFIMVLVLLVSIVILSQIRPLSLKILKVAERLALLRRVVPGLRSFYEGSYMLFKPGATLTAVLLGTVSWLGEGIGFYLILVGLGLPPTLETLSVSVFVLAFSTVVGAITALPGGLGAAEASISGMLVLLLGVQTDTAAAGTLLIRFATLWFGIAIGLLVWTRSKDLLGLTTSGRESAEITYEVF
jgi:uncharacterized protein (TIRG00374 family)